MHQILGLVYHLLPPKKSIQLPKVSRLQIRVASFFHHCCCSLPHIVVSRWTKRPKRLEQATRYAGLGARSGVSGSISQETLHLVGINRVRGPIGLELRVSANKIRVCSGCVIRFAGLCWRATQHICTNTITSSCYTMRGSVTRTQSIVICEIPANDVVAGFIDWMCEACWRFSTWRAHRALTN